MNCETSGLSLTQRNDSVAIVLSPEDQTAFFDAMSHVVMSAFVAGFFFGALAYSALLRPLFVWFWDSFLDRPLTFLFLRSVRCKPWFRSWRKSNRERLVARA